MASTLVALGIKSYMQYGREAAGQYGGGSATINRRIALLGGMLQANPSLAEAAYMPAGIDGAAWGTPSLTDDANSVVKTAEWVDGSLEFYFDYENVLQFFDMVYGTPTFGTYNAIYTGGTPNEHDFKEAYPWFNSIQAELIENSAVTTCAKAVGLQVESLLIKGKAAAGEAAIVRMTAGVVGQVKTLAASITGSVYMGARHPVTMAQMSSVTDGSDDSGVRVRDFEISIKPKVENKGRLYGGSLYPDQQIRSGPVEVTLKITREYTSDALMTKYVAGTQVASTQISFADTANRNFQFTIPKGYILAAPQPTPTMDGLLLQEVTIKALWSVNGICMSVAAFKNSRTTTTA